MNVLSARHFGMRQSNSGLSEFGNIISQVGNSRLGWRRSGIHAPDRGYGFQVRSFHSRPGMAKR